MNAKASNGEEGFAGTGRLSVVVPVLNDAHALSELLPRLKQLAGVDEIIVADGGSVDASVDVARGEGVRVVCSPPGRGTQQRAGAEAAGGDILWFVHADSQVPAAAPAAIRRALEPEAVVGGNFSLVFGTGLRADRFMTWFYARVRLLGLAYGDSAFFVRRGVYEAVGGFSPVRLFEDIDLLRRLRRKGRFVTVPERLVTSGRRYARRPFALVFMEWCVLQGFYWLGADPDRLAAWYYRGGALRKSR